MGPLSAGPRKRVYIYIHTLSLTHSLTHPFILSHTHSFTSLTSLTRSNSPHTHAHTPHSHSPPHVSPHPSIPSPPSHSRRVLTPLGVLHTPHLLPASLLLFLALSTHTHTLMPFSHSPPDSLLPSHSPSPPCSVCGYPRHGVLIGG